VAGVAPTRPDEREHHERADPGRRRRPVDAQHRGGGLCGVRPPPFFELEPGTVGEQVEEVELEAAFAAVGDSRLGVRAGGLASVHLELHPGEVGVRSSDLQLVAHGMGAFEALAEPVRRPSRDSLGVRHGDVGVQRKLGVAQLLRELHGTAAPYDRLRVTPRRGVVLRHDRIRQCELAGGAEVFEKCDRPLRCGVRLLNAARAPEDVGEVAQGVPFAARVAESAVTIGCLLERCRCRIGR
jgi:hypothetical protein